MEPLADSWRFFIAPGQPGPKSGKKDTMPGRAPRRYKMDENGTMHSAFHGKLPEEFSSFPEGLRRNPRRHPCGGL